MGRPYQGDFYGWMLDQADALRRRSANEIDWENLLEEVEGLAGSERRELRNRLALVIQHLLKWRFQPGHRSKSWLATIREQRAKVFDLLEESPSLKSHLDDIMPKAFRAGLNDALAETGLGDLMLAKLEGPMTRTGRAESYRSSTRKVKGWSSPSPAGWVSRRISRQADSSKAGNRASPSGSASTSVR